MTKQQEAELRQAFDEQFSREKWSSALSQHDWMWEAAKLGWEIGQEEGFLDGMRAEQQNHHL